MFDLIVSIPDHCLSFYFIKILFGEINVLINKRKSRHSKV